MFTGRKIRGFITVMSHYHYCIDPNMGEGKCSLQHIPFDFVSCTDQLDHVWVPDK